MKAAQIAYSVVPMSPQHVAEAARIIADALEEEKCKEKSQSQATSTEG